MNNPLSGMKILDERGRAHSFDELWSERPVVLAFVRHFG